MSTSWADGLRLLRAWRRQRYSAPLWLPVALTLTLASALALDLRASWALALWRVAAAWCALGGLRLWDDLEDLHHDRAHHPERALVQAESVAPAWAGVACALCAAAAFTALGGGRLFVLGALGLTLGVFYRLQWHTRRAGPWLRLLKYPAMVVALGGGSGWRDALAMAVVYAGVCLDERLQEAGKGARLRAARACLLLATMLLFALPQMVRFL